MKKRFFLLAALLMISFGASAQYDPQMPLPINPDMKIGKLENGLTYYILHNEEPKDRADFYIIYSVGAIQETDEQNGLAHFLEHMAFNGTKNFPGGNSEPTSLVKTLERHAMAFGRNINAYTTYDRTVYHLDGAPVTDKPLIDTCLLVLHDWAHYISLEGDEIDNERGVISEEWRTRNNSSARMRKQWFPLIFGDTKYSTHDVIGSYEVINNFKHEEIRKFYYDWYRTDQQAVAVVGDIDVNEIEKKIKDIFSEIPAVENPKQKEEVVLPQNEEPLYVLATDKEETRPSIQIMMIEKSGNARTAGDMRRTIIDQLYNSMLGQRIADKSIKGEPVMIAGSASKGGFLPGYEAYTIALAPKPGKDCEGLQMVYTEAVRAQRFGFLQSELDRTKLDLLNKLENEYKAKDKITNSKLISEIVEVFAYDKISMKIDDYYKIRKALIEEITLADVNKVASGYPTFKNTKIILLGPPDWEAPAKEQILDVFAKVDNDRTIEPQQDAVIAEKLIDGEIVPGKVVKEKALPVFGAKQWTMSNGAKVIFANASYDKDNIALSGKSEGGKSLYPDDEVKKVELALMFAPSLGLGKMSGDEFDKFIKGKKAKASIGVDSYHETVSGESTIKDFETMMQILYLRFVEPKFDEALLKNYSDRFATLFKMLNAQPAMAMSDSLTAIVSNYSKRTESVKSEDFASVDIKDVEKYYRERVCDGSDFTFLIVGDIDEATAKTMSEKYIGSIPSTYRKEHWKNDHISLPQGRTDKKVYIPFETPKACVAMVYNQKMKVSQKSKLTMGVLANILRTRYITNIREKEGGTYGVSVKSETSTIPENDFTLAISFETAVEKAEYLKGLIEEEFDRIINDGVTEEEISNVVKNTLKEREQLKAKNAFVKSCVERYVFDGINMTDPKNYEDILNGITPSDIQKFAKKFFKNKKTDNVNIIFSTEK